MWDGGARLSIDALFRAQSTELARWGYHIELHNLHELFHTLRYDNADGCARLGRSLRYNMRLVFCQNARAEGCLMTDSERIGKRRATAGADGPAAPTPTASSNDLIDYVTDHAQQLAAMALTAGRPKASALLTLAATQLRQPG